MKKLSILLIGISLFCVSSSSNAFEATWMKNQGMLSLLTVIKELKKYSGTACTDKMDDLTRMACSSAYDVIIKNREAEASQLALMLVAMKLPLLQRSAQRRKKVACCDACCRDSIQRQGELRYVQA